MKKTCKSCQLEKSIKEFHRNIQSKDGYRAKCKDCRAPETRIYNNSNKDRIKELNKKYRYENKDYIKSYMEGYRDQNRESLNKKKREHYKENKDYYIENAKQNYRENKFRHNEKSRVRKNSRRREDALYKLRCNTSTLIRNCVGRNGGNKSKKTIQILGCLIEEFKQHIEEQFEPWMNWSNWGVNCGEYDKTWQLDHIVPTASARSEEEVIKLNHYSNFQPLCSKRNKEKGDSLIY